MKKFAIISLVISVLLVLNACKKTPQEMVIGKWKIDKIENSEKMGDAEIEMFNRINKDKIDNEIFDFSIEKLSIKYPQEAVCQWDLSEDGKTLTVYYPEDGEHKYEIISMDKNQIVWKEDFEDFYHTTTLIKVK
jgi:hypothetical protein